MTDDRDLEPGDDELRRLLGSADRPRGLRDDELARIRNKVEGLAASSPTSPPDHLHVAGHAAEPQRSSISLGARVLVVAAAAAVVIGFLVLSGGENTNELQLAGDPEALVQTPLEQTCTREIARLGAGIDAWDGVANWALTQTGQPALDTLASDALLALARIEGLEAEAAAALGALDQELAALGELPAAQSRAARTEAVTAAATTIVELVQGHPMGAGCDLGRLRAALDG